MDPITLITLAANIVPSLLKFVGKGEKTVAIAESIGTVAKQIAGTDNPEEAFAAIDASAAKKLEFQIAMMNNEMEYAKMYLGDVQDARKRDTEIRLKLGANLRADGMVIGAAIFVLFLVWIIWNDPNINEFAQGVFTLVLGRMLGYLDGIYNFEFGTTRETKESTKTTNDLRAFARRKEIEDK